MQTIAALIVTTAMPSLSTMVYMFLNENIISIFAVLLEMSVVQCRFEQITFLQRSKIIEKILIWCSNRQTE